MENQEYFVQATITKSGLSVKIVKLGKSMSSPFKVYLNDKPLEKLFTSKKQAVQHCAKLTTFYN